MQNDPHAIIAPTASLDKTSVVEAPVRIYGSVQVHRDCRIGRFSVVNQNSCLHVGTLVGRYCTIGRNVEIGAREQPLSRLSTSVVSHGMADHFPDHCDVFPQVPVMQPQKTTIGNDVWIAANAVISHGVTIGDGAVIGAGACVTQDVGPYDIVGGVPACVIGARFAPEVVAALLDLKWWDLAVAELATVPLDDITAAVARLRHIRATQTASTAGTMADMAPAAPPRAAHIAALQAMVNAVPADPRHAPDAAHLAFAAFLRDKLFDAGAPDTLIDAVMDTAAGLETRYAADNPVDISVLNSKLQHLIDLVALRADPEAPLDVGLRRTIRDVLRTKL